MTIDGKEFDDLPKEITPRIFGETQEGPRTRVKHLWLDRYVDDGNGAKVCESWKLTLSNYGSVTLDGKPIRDPKDIDLVKSLFGGLDKTNKNQ